MSAKKSTFFFEKLNFVQFFLLPHVFFSRKERFCCRLLCFALPDFPF